MANFHNGFLQRGEQLGQVNLDILLSADNTIINPGQATLIRLYSDSATATSRTFTIQSTTVMGAQLTLVFMSGSSYTCELLSTGNMSLNGGTWTPIQYQSIVIEWNGTVYQEICRNNLSAANFNLADGAIPIGNSSGIAVGIVPTGDVTITDAGVTAIGAGKVLESMLIPQAVGLNAMRVCIGVFNPSANTGERTIAAHTISVALPAKAIVRQFYYQVITTFTGATSAATIALSIESANDLVSAIAISDGTTPWTAGNMVAGIPVGTAATMVKTTVSRTITATVAVQALTAGKLYIYAEYVQGF